MTPASAGRVPRAIVLSYQTGAQNAADTTVIGAILGNAGLILILAALVVSFVKHRNINNHKPFVQLLLNDMVFYAVGLGFLYVGVFHAFLQQMTSAAIGWAPSPFEWELAFAEFGVGATGV